MPSATNAEIMTALRQSVVTADRTNRGRVRVLGKDRVRLLHNLTTNDIKNLAVGGGCEAFVTSTQGKTLGFVTLHAEADQFLMRCDPGGLNLLCPHFQKYGALDDVEFIDESEATFELHVAGARAIDLLTLLIGPRQAGSNLSISRIAYQNTTLEVIREDPLGTFGFSLIGNAAALADLPQSLFGELDLGTLRGLNMNAWEALRIEAGTPAFGMDITEANLPQEIARDASAINFNKGCYLGQETVARIDAIGHVNKLLRRVEARTKGALEPGMPLFADGKQTGTVTSAAVSMNSGLPIGLAMLRVGFDAAGTQLLAGNPAAAFEVEVASATG
jgi:folate-binding protein YgfZ